MSLQHYDVVHEVNAIYIPRWDSGSISLASIKTYIDYVDRGACD